LSPKSPEKLKKFQSIPLLNFESYVDDHLLLDAERLYDEGALTLKSPLENGEWRGDVYTDGTGHQVRAGVVRGIIQQASCECHHFATHTNCSHVICLFFGIRNAYVDNIRSKEKGAGSKRKKTDYLGAVLKKADTADLKAFMAGYALKDKTFKLMLTTHFSRRIHESTGPDLYERILDECFPVQTLNTRKSLVPEIRLLLRVSREMLVVYRDALSLESYTEAFQLIRSLLPKLAYALYIAEKENKFLSALEQEAHVAFKLLLNDRLAPGLKHEIVDAMILIIEKSFYRYRGPENLCELVMLSGPTGEQVHAFCEVMKEKEARGKDLTEKAFHMAYYIHALFRYRKQGVRSELAGRFKNDPVLMIETIRKMLELGFVEDAEKTLDFYHEKERIDELSYYRFQLRFLESAGRNQEAAKTALKLFILGLERKYLDLAKSLAGKLWPEIYRETIHLLSSAGGDKRYMIAIQLAEKEKDANTLFELLENKNDPELFMRYDHHLTQTHPDQLYRFYRTYIMDHLREHAGEKPAQKVIHILDHLASVGLKKMTNRLEREILDLFPERKTMSDMIRSSEIRN
jgi:hypothetical protein